MLAEDELRWLFVVAVRGVVVCGSVMAVEGVDVRGDTASWNEEARLAEKKKSIAVTVSSCSRSIMTARLGE